MKLKYSVLIRWSEEDKVYIASLPEFGPYCSTHGSTYEEAAKNAAEVLEMLMDTATQKSETLPAPDLFPAGGLDAIAPASGKVKRTATTVG